MSRESRRQLGQFVNVLPFRLKTDIRQNLMEHLSLNKTSMFEVLRHQDATVEQIIEWLQAPRSALHAPLMQIGFAWERIPLMGPFESFFVPGDTSHVIDTQGVVLSPFFVPQQEGQYELALEMGGMSADGAYSAQLKYRSDLFTHDTVHTWAQAFTRFVSDALSTPVCPASRLSVLSPEQTHALMKQGAGPTRQLPAGTVLDRFAVISARHSTYTALIQTSQAPGAGSPDEITYGDLARSVNRLASRLRDLSVQPGTHVGVACARGGGWVIALLAVWSVGAVYVPIDLELPAQRIAFMLQDAQLQLLLVDDSGQACMAQQISPDRMLNMDQLPADLLGAEAAAPGLINADSPAYLLYTSGSTGQPKGVRVSHRNLLNVLTSLQDTLCITPHDRWLSLTTPSFDISLLEMLLPLMHGASVFVCNKMQTTDMDALAHCVTEYGVTVMQATPTHWRLLLDNGWQGSSGLKALCGGEALSEALAARLLLRVQNLWNVYGPTETTIWSTCTQVRPDEPIVLGRPLANTQLLVLDADQHMCLPGVVGELWIGGQGVAIDYFNQPELTDQRFQINTHYPQLGRLYRTGDWVRLGSHSELHYQGRLDGQIKFNGHRIELGEIEHAFRRIAPGVEAVALLVKPTQKTVGVSDEAGADASGECLALVMAVMGPCPADWAEQLRSMLPSYMVPQQVIALNSFAQTPNGKIDKAQMAIQCAGLYAQALLDHTQLRQPRSHEEAQLMSWFAQALGRETVPLERSFFELGGQSLQAVQLMAQIKKQTGIALASALLLEYPSVETLATYLRRQKKSQTVSHPSTATSTQRPGRKHSDAFVLNRGAPDVTPLWLFHPIGGTIFCYSPLSQALDPRRPVYAFEALSLTDPLQAEVSIEGLASRYVESVLSVQPQGPYLLGGWCFGGLIAHEVAGALLKLGHPVEAVLMLDTRAPSGQDVKTAVTDAQLLEWFARDLARAQGRQLRMDWELLAEQGHQAALQSIHQQAISESLLPSDTALETVELAFNTFLAHGIALQTHELAGGAGSDLGVQTLLVMANDEPEDFGHHLGWDRWINPFQLKSIAVPGDHYSMMHKPQVDTVADLIELTFPIYSVASPGGDTADKNS